MTSKIYIVILKPPQTTVNFLQLALFAKFYNSSMGVNCVRILKFYRSFAIQCRYLLIIACATIIAVKSLNE